MQTYKFLEYKYPFWQEYLNYFPHPVILKTAGYNFE